jgi:hypothetical protein
MVVVTLNPVCNVGVDNCVIRTSQKSEAVYTSELPQFVFPQKVCLMYLVGLHKTLAFISAASESGSSKD